MKSLGLQPGADCLARLREQAVDSHDGGSPLRQAPEIAVPGPGPGVARMGCRRGGVADAIATLNRERARVIVAVECATGLLPEVRAGLAKGLRADLWLDASEAWVDAAAVGVAGGAVPRGDDPLFGVLSP